MARQSLGSACSVPRSSRSKGIALGLTALGLAACTHYARDGHSHLSAASEPPLAVPRAVSAADAAPRARVSESYGNLPLSFEANQGQTDPRVKFLSRGKGYALFLTSTEAVLSLQKRVASADRPETKTLLLLGKNEIPQYETTVLRMKLLGANPSPAVAGAEELPGKSNYLIGNDPAKWQAGVPNYAKVRYEGIYPGVDLVYHGSDQRWLEYDLAVAPGADPAVIRLGFEGAERLALDDEGNLVLHTAGGQVIEHAPVVYQEIGGARQLVNGRYEIEGEHEIGFRIASYDVTRPLIIDPVLGYSTYLGGSGDDYGYAIAVDDLGSA